MAGGRRIWIPKKAGELVTIPFDFISDLSVGETLLTAVVVASVYSGIDAFPAAIVSGVATIEGTVVTQNIQGGLLGVIYGLLCRVVTSEGQLLEISAYCPIQPNLP